ncbi:hypothetical protein KP509_29G054600 [Ceratopteris richardii]|uniref:Pectinesterase n=1 Tax=Ceratopteris richardii TaxID=49495 RepID=A0A8T2R8E5_CERRI|nr:hypothetical protein KP509_29G054600 [Ceratopteris richardii]
MLPNRYRLPLLCMMAMLAVLLLLLTRKGAEAGYGLLPSWSGGSRRLAEDEGGSNVGESDPLTGVDGLRYMSVGVGGFPTIQAAIDAVPDSNSVPTIIRISPGVYEERVVIPSLKPFITLQGSGMDLTIVQWHLKASDHDENGAELTAYNTASVTVYASNFVAKDITFKNTLPAPPPGIEGRQAAAFRISGDKAAFYRCGFVGGQDTLCDDQGRHYFEDCFIQGSIDFVFGDGRSLYNRCELNSIAQSYGSIAAQDRQSLDDNTEFNGIIDPRGWDDWDHDTSKDKTVYYGQYKCNGAGADESKRVEWSHELSDEEALPYLDVSFIDGDEWLSTT